MASSYQRILLALWSFTLVHIADCWWFNCPPGTYYYPFRGCQDCRPGHYCPGFPWVGIEYRCPDGSFAVQKRSVECTDCPAGSACPRRDQLPKKCPLGSYSLEQSTSCIGCPAGSACPKTDQSPEECPLGSYSPANSVSCMDCPANYFCLEPELPPFPPNPPVPEYRFLINRSSYFSADAWVKHNVTADTDIFWSQYSHGFISHIGNEIIVAFRGTATLKQWTTNAIYLQDEYSNCPGCLVHTGMHQSYKTVKQYIIAAVEKYSRKYPNAILYVTGHSLGGGHATIAAADLAKRGYKKPNLITFGSPRVGNEQFAKYIERITGKNLRVTYRHDIITDLPPRKMPFGIGPFLIYYYYQHVGSEVHYVDKHTAVILPKNLNVEFLHRTNRSDHSIDNYKGLF